MKIYRGGFFLKKHKNGLRPPDLDVGMARRQNSKHDRYRGGLFGCWDSENERDLVGILHQTKSGLSFDLSQHCFVVKNPSIVEHQFIFPRSRISSSGAFLTLLLTSPIYAALWISFSLWKTQFDVCLDRSWPRISSYYHRPLSAFVSPETYEVTGHHASDSNAYKYLGPFTYPLFEGGALHVHHLRPQFRWVREGVKRKGKRNSTLIDKWARNGMYKSKQKSPKRDSIK